MVKRSFEQKLRWRNFDARHGKIEMVKNRKGLSGVEIGGKGTCYQWKEKGQCSKGNHCSFRHESNDRAQQKPNPKAAPPSEPSMTRGRSVSRKRSVKGKSNPGIILRQPCRYDLKGACTRTPCEHWHPPECQFHKNESGCKAEDKCLFPNHKVDEQQSQKRATILQKEEKATTKMQWLLWKFVSQMGCFSQDSESLDSQRGNKPRETRCKKSWDRFEEYGSLSLRLRQASIQKKKGPSLGKVQVKNPHQRSPYAMKFEDQSQEETERQQRCA